MSIETTHHDIPLSYDEKEDQWVCRSMELKAKSLGLLRKKMDKVLSVERRIDNLPVIMTSLGWSGSDKLYTGYATLFDRKASYGGFKVWVNALNGNRTERHKMSLTNVWIDNPENRARLQAIFDQSAVVRAEGNKLREMEKAAQAFTITQLEVAALTTLQDVDTEFDPPPKEKK